MQPSDIKVGSGYVGKSETGLLFVFWVTEITSSEVRGFWAKEDGNCMDQGGWVALDQALIFTSEINRSKFEMLRNLWKPSNL